MKWRQKESRSEQVAVSLVFSTAGSSPGLASVRRPLLPVLTLPAWVPLLFLVLLFEFETLPRERSFLRRMRQAGRVLQPGALHEILAAGRGTLIVEWPEARATYSRLWWTAEQLPPAGPDDDCDSVAKVAAQQTDAAGGPALLVAVGNGEWESRRLEQRFPAMRQCCFGRARGGFRT